MTEPVPGSSLLQARDVHSPSHNHRHHTHNHARSHQHQRLHDRQEDPSETVVQIVQTVSVVQLVDATGAAVGATTQTSEPSTTTALVQLGATIGIPSVPDLISTRTGDDVTGTPLPTSITTTAYSVDASSSMPSSFPTVESFAPLTSTPSSGSSTAFPTFSGVTNSTAVTASPTAKPSLPSNGTVSLASFSGYNLTTSTLASSSGTILFNETFTTTIFDDSSSTTSEFAFSTPTGASISTGNADTPTGLVGGSGGSPTAYATPSPTNGDGAASKSSSPPAGTVAGSVLGALAGLSLILIAALYLLRWKKRQRGLRLSDRNSLPGTRGLTLGGGGPASGGSGGGAMHEVTHRRSIPFAIPAALASLTNPKRFSRQTNTSAEGTEKGFQKVSGRKLPSVLQHGGDGYSDPTARRDTVLTDQSFYRESADFFTGPNMPRLAVGSPMRPDSGIPVFHPGPARTPVTESGHFNPFLDPPPTRDPLGRSHPSRDGSSRSHGSASRFTEQI